MWKSNICFPKYVRCVCLSAHFSITNFDPNFSCNHFSYPVLGFFHTNDLRKKKCCRLEIKFFTLIDINSFHFQYFQINVASSVPVGNVAKATTDFKSKFSPDFKLLPGILSQPVKDKRQWARQM